MIIKKAESFCGAVERKPKVVFYCAIIVALGIGIFIGAFSGNRTEKIGLSKNTCDNINAEIGSLAIMGIDESVTNKLRELNKIYEANCKGKRFKPAKTVSAPVSEPVMVESEKRPERTCEVIERKRLELIFDEMNASANDLVYNAVNYSHLVKYGCPENMEKFKQLAIRQINIANAMNGDMLSEYDIYHNVGFYKDKLRVYRDLAEQGEFVREARRIMEMANRLGEPALEFIGEIERILSE
ncbi:MAG: hypothetical protein FWG80_02470 [Alphaproteobacteria bacterium]|nr:hypothetical protein [Alphaproteobacteria bacterium]